MAGAVDAGLPCYTSFWAIFGAQEDGGRRVCIYPGHDALILHLPPHHEHLYVIAQLSFRITYIALFACQTTEILFNNCQILISP